MSLAVELKIHRLLKSRKNLTTAVSDMLGKVTDPVYSWEDRIKILNFAINAGFHKDCIKTISQWSKTEEKLPWAQIIEIFSQHKFRPEHNLLLALFWGAQELGQFEELGISRGWDVIEPKFQQIYLAFQNHLLVNHKNNAQRLLDRLEFSRQHRMIDEEKLALDELRKNYPEFLVDDDDRNIEERWARDVLNRSQSHDELTDRWPRPNQEAEKFSQFLLKEIKKRKDLRDQLVIDFAIMFKFFDFPERGLEVLSANQDTRSAENQWLCVELMIQSRRYIDALDALDRLSAHAAENPETSFATAYYRSIILWELGHRQDAIDKLKALVKIRADYRSAHSLLHSWLVEEI